MERSTDASTAELTCSLPTATHSTSRGDEQQTAVAQDTQEPTGNRDVKNAVPTTMDDILDDPQPQHPHTGQAHRRGEDGDLGGSHHSDNAVDRLVGVQHSQVNLVSSVTEKNEMQERGNGGKSPIPYSSDMGVDAQDDHDDQEALHSHLQPAYAETSGGSQLDHSIEQADNDVHNDDIGYGIFAPADAGETPPSSYGDNEADNDDESSEQEGDHEVAKHSCIHCSRLRTLDYPCTRQTIEEHLSIPDQQSFTSLGDLLSSHNAPGRGLYTIEEVVKKKNRKAADLEEDIRCLQAQLDAVSELRDEARTVMLRACTTFSASRDAAGISHQLWAEYEAFCESLESKFGSKRGWSVTCFHNHNNSYPQWDPDLDLFKDSAEIPLGDCNFRCEASTINTNGRTEYVVEFWALDHLEPRKGTAKTWKQQYPNLYRLAQEAVHNSLGRKTVPQELLLSLPNPNLPFANGWLFEYFLEPARAKHATLSRRWSYRRACRIPVPGQQDSQLGYLATASESDDTTSQDTEMDREGSESCESHDEDMEDAGSGSVGSWQTDSEDVQ